MKYFLMIDIGASSGRHMIGHIENDKIVYEEIHRFKMQQGKWKWHYGVLMHDIVDGMIKCKQAGKIPSSMGIDTFGVEACFIDKYGEPLEVAALLRDNVGLYEAFEEGKYRFMDPVKMYNRTGCPDMAANFAYQLLGIKDVYPSLYEKINKILPMPDFLTYLLTGELSSEYTLATTSGLVNIKTSNYDKDIINAAGLDSNMFVDLTMPGTFIGRLRKELVERIGYDLDVIQVATHDSASANLAAPIKDDSSVLISSGTWSIMGIESFEPLISKKGLMHNFHNEGNYELRYRILKNLTGTVLLQRIVKDYNGKYDFPDLIEMAKKTGDFPSRVDVVNSRELMAEGTMEDVIKDICRKTKQKVPSSLGEVLACIYHSIALGYKNTIDELEECIEKKISSIYLFSGGSRDIYLNQLTADTTGLTVYAGPTEAAVVGNMLIQLMYDNHIENLEEARSLVEKSFEIKEFKNKLHMSR